MSGESDRSTSRAREPNSGMSGREIGQIMERLRNAEDNLDDFEKRMTNRLENLEHIAHQSSNDIARFEEKFIAEEGHQARSQQLLKEEMVEQDARTEHIFKEYVENASVLEKESNIFRVDLEKRISNTEKNLAIIEALKLDKADAKGINVYHIIALCGWVLTIVLFMVIHLI